MYVIYSTETGYSDESMRHATRQEAVEHKRQLEAASFTDFAIRWED